MLNVLYVSGSDNRAKYLDQCLEKHSWFCLTEQERTFIKDLLLLIAYYINSILIEEECNTVTFARLLYFCPAQTKDKSRFLSFVECALQNEDHSLNEDQIAELRRLLKNIKSNYCSINMLITLQAIQLDCMMNPECNRAVVNLINLALLRCTSDESSLLDNLYGPCSDDKYSMPVFPEFSARYENLLEKNDCLSKYKLQGYVNEKYESLPACVKQRLGQYDFQIRLSNELFGKSFDLKKMGSTHINDKKIRVWLENSKTSIDISFLHEMGHVVDYIFGANGLISKSQNAWGIIFKLDKERYFKLKMSECPELEILHEYAIVNQTEYFASSFADYIENPEWLRAAVPDTYYYIESLLHSAKV